MRKQVMLFSALALGLTGCASAAEPEAAPGPALSEAEFTASVAACRDFWIEDGYRELYAGVNDPEAVFEATHDVDAAVVEWRYGKWVVEIPWRDGDAPSDSVSVACTWDGEHAELYDFSTDEG